MEKNVELDAAFMDGETLSFGAIGAVQSVKNPITLARLLSKEKVNNFLVGEGALKYTITHGLKTQKMLSERAEIHHDNRVKEIKEKEISPYDGHDTVGMVALDTKEHMA